MRRVEKGESLVRRRRARQLVYSPRPQNSHKKSKDGRAWKNPRPLECIRGRGRYGGPAIICSVRLFFYIFQRQHYHGGAVTRQKRLQPELPSPAKNSACPLEQQHPQGPQAESTCEQATSFAEVLDSRTSYRSVVL